RRRIDVAQLLAPESQVVRGYLRFVAKGQRVGERRRYRIPRGDRVVAGGKLPDQDGQRRRVADDVVGRQDHDASAGVDVEARDPQRQLGREVEGVPRELRHDGL